MAHHTHLSSVQNEVEQRHRFVISLCVGVLQENQPHKANKQIQRVRTNFLELNDDC